jgi:hypothetical protein
MLGFNAGGDSARGDRFGFVGEGRLALSAAEGPSSTAGKNICRSITRLARAVNSHDRSDPPPLIFVSVRKNAPFVLLELRKI